MLAQQLRVLSRFKLVHLGKTVLAPQTQKGEGGSQAVSARSGGKPSPQPRVSNDQEKRSRKEERENCREKQDEVLGEQREPVNVEQTEGEGALSRYAFR